MNPLIVDRELAHFVETDAFSVIKTWFDYALATGKAVRVFGDPGLGKTVSLLKLVENTGARMMTVTQRSKSTMGMYDAIIRSFGEIPDCQYLRQFIDRAERIVGIPPHKTEAFDPVDFKNYGWNPARLLIVDEYQTLEPTALRDLLEFSWNTQLPLFLSGNSESLADRSKQSRQAQEQLNQRLLWSFKIGKPSYRDCRNIGIEFNVEGADAYEAVAAFGMRKSLRELVVLLEKAMLFMGDSGSIKLPTLEMTLLANGGEQALKLLKPIRSGEQAQGNPARRTVKSA